MLLRKLRAGALQLTLHIVIVIGLMLIAFILLIHLHNRFKIQSTFVRETVENCNRGIHSALNNNLINSDTITVNLNEEDYKSLKVHRSYWGAFEKISAISRIKKHESKKIALVGGSQKKLNRPSLYLEETKTPLVLVGASKIDGVAYLPIQGVKPGYISGESYQGTQLIYGQSKVIRDFPKLSKDWLNYINALDFTGAQIQNNQFLQIENNKTYSNSFNNATKVIYDSNKINLSFISLTGNIIVQSQSEIVVDASSNLKDVLLIAPKISIKNGVQGNFQAIASKVITVGENVSLNYPSSLILNEKPNLNTVTNQSITIPIEIGDNSTIKGQVIFNGISKVNNYDTQIFISEDATVKGEVFCNQNIELLGTIEGSVFTQNFIVHKGGSIYQNHIYNGKIIINKLPEEYVGLLIDNSKKAVAKWLY